VERLLVALRRACETKDRATIASLLAAFRDRLASPDEEAEQSVFAEIHRRSLAGRKLLVMILTYPAPKRGRVLRSRMSEAAPPAPAALPSLSDPNGVASFLGGPRPDDAKLYLVRELEEHDSPVLASTEVRTALLDLVTRSAEGGKLATTALRLLRQGPREQVENVALRTIDSSAHASLRRVAVRLLRSCAGPEGVARLLRLVRDCPDLVTRRLAANALHGKRLGAAGVETLRTVALDEGEDRMLRINAIRTLRSIRDRAAAGADIAASTVEASVISDLEGTPR
jgi:hypothetical protein